jgi:hypothetical protein
MKSKIIFPLILVSLLFGTVRIFAEDKSPEFQTSASSDVPQAIVISAHGKCEYSEDGILFLEFKDDHIFRQGEVIRTGEKSRTDIFFKRIGTTVRLQPGTEVKLEKMERHLKDGQPVMDTLIALHTGRIFTVIRSLVPGSTFEIRNAAGRSVVEGGGGEGRYIITADGTHVSDKDSTVPLKVVGETGITVISPGMKFNAKDGKMLPANAANEVEMLIDIDELHSISDQTNAVKKPEKK